MKLTEKNIDEVVKVVKDNIGAESEFKSVMSDKVGQKLEDERRIVSKDMITKHIPQPETDDDEI